MKERQIAMSIKFLAEEFDKSLFIQQLRLMIFTKMLESVEE